MRSIRSQCMPIFMILGLKFKPELMILPLVLFLTKYIASECFKGPLGLTELIGEVESIFHIPGAMLLQAKCDS